MKHIIVEISTDAKWSRVGKSDWQTFPEEKSYCKK